MMLCATVATANLVAIPVSADVTELPQAIQDSLYNPVFLDPMQPIADSAFRDFIAKNPPHVDYRLCVQLRRQYLAGGCDGPVADRDHPEMAGPGPD